jgi:hypothetical protein
MSIKSYLVKHGGVKRTLKRARPLFYYILVVGLLVAGTCLLTIVFLVMKEYFHG